MVNKKILKLMVCVFLSPMAIAHVPPGESPFYYRIGGGESYPLPPTASIHTVPIKLGVKGSMNWNCGQFDPKKSVVNSLNNMKDSIHNIQSSVIDNAKSGIGNFPMYMLQRASPGLYDMLNKFTAGAYDQFKVASSDCDKMEALMAQGKNPYENWLTLSTRSGWKQSFSISDTDVNKAKSHVKSMKGNNGIEWLGGESRGGVSQKPIKIIEDTSVAGFNSLLGRSENNYGFAQQSDDTLIKYWKKPTECASWIVEVLGEQQIQTKSDAEDNKSTPGVGLLPGYNKLSEDIVKELNSLLRNPSLRSQENLRQVSAPGVDITLDVFLAIDERDSYMQGVLIKKIAQDAAMAITIEKAYLAKRVLNSGASVPNIRKAEPALIEIDRAINRLDGEIQDLINMVRMKKETVSHTLSALLEERHHRINKAVAYSSIKQSSISEISHGGVKAQ